MRLGKYPQLKAPPYLEINGQSTSFFKQKQKYASRVDINYIKLLKALSLLLFSLPTNVGTNANFGVKQISKTANLVWLLTPLTVIRL